MHALWLAPLLSTVVYCAALSADLSHPISMTIAVALVCAAWWIVEPIALAATALVPMAIFPLAGILDNKAIAAAYGNPMILLMLGGALISKAMEVSGAHRRLALSLLRISGANDARRLVWAVILTCSLLSMWISNTATALMMLPVVLALASQVPKALTIPLLLAVAYGCSLGGLATPIGTPPNLLFLEFYRQATGQQIGFLTWMSHMLPLALLLVILTGWWLSKNLNQKIAVVIPAAIHWSSREKRTLTVFLLTATAWVTLDGPAGGWRGWLGLEQASYSSVALAAAVLLFITPSGNGQQRLLNWAEAKQIEWGIFILFAGGITLANAFTSSGLSALLAQNLTALTYIPLWLCVLGICLSVTFLTEITSNTATATLLMPILASAAVALQIDPILLMLPAALSASCAFMLPVATPPNAIVFASGELQVIDMARAGLVINIVGAFFITALVMVVYS